MLQKKIIYVLGVCGISLFGCRTLQHYGYEHVSIDLFEGELSIDAVGFLGDSYEKDGKKLIDYSFPYHILFSYVESRNSDLAKIILRDIELVGESSNEIYYLGDIESDDVRTYEETTQISFGVGPLSSAEYEYESYTLNATVIIYRSGEVYKEEGFSVVLKTEYRNERRSDWFDRVMGV